MSSNAMRRKDRQLDMAAALGILEAGEYGILSTVDKGGQPYGTPLSYAVADGFIWFHCAGEGHKLRNLAHEAKVCFTVVGKTQPVYEGSYTTRYESTVVFGSASRVEDIGEKTKALELICKKYLPQHMDKFADTIKKSLGATDVWQISLDQITGKARR